MTMLGNADDSSARITEAERPIPNMAKANATQRKGEKCMPKSAAPCMTKSKQKGQPL